MNSRLRIKYPLRFIRAVLILLLLLVIIFFGVRGLLQLFNKPAEPSPSLQLYEGDFIQWPDEPSEALQEILSSDSPDL